MQPKWQFKRIEYIYSSPIQYNMSNMKGRKTTTHSIKRRVIDLSIFFMVQPHNAVAIDNFFPVFVVVVVAGFFLNAQ